MVHWLWREGGKEGWCVVVGVVRHGRRPAQHRSYSGGTWANTASDRGWRSTSSAVKRHTWSSLIVHVDHRAVSRRTATKTKIQRVRLQSAPVKEEVSRRGTGGDQSVSPHGHARLQSVPFSNCYYCCRISYISTPSNIYLQVTSYAGYEVSQR